MSVGQSFENTYRRKLTPACRLVGLPGHGLISPHLVTAIPDPTVRTSMDLEKVVSSTPIPTRDPATTMAAEVSPAATSPFTPIFPSTQARRSGVVLDPKASHCRRISAEGYASWEHTPLPTGFHVDQ